MGFYLCGPTTACCSDKERKKGSHWVLLVDVLYERGEWETVRQATDSQIGSSSALSLWLHLGFLVWELSGSLPDIGSWSALVADKNMSGLIETWKGKVTMLPCPGQCWVLSDWDGWEFWIFPGFCCLGLKTLQSKILRQNQARQTNK